MTRWMSLSVALLCVACAAAPTTVPTAESARSPAPSVEPSPELESVGGVAFGVPTPAHLRAIAAAEKPTQYQTGHQVFLRGANSIASRLTSGNENFSYSFPHMFEENEAASSVTTGELPNRGDATAYVRDAVRPLVAAWAADATLMTDYYVPPRSGFGPSYPDPTPQPEAFATETGILALAGWPLAYRSAARHEMLYVYGESGIVLKVRWAPKVYTEQTVPVSKAGAIALHVAAMRDPNSVSDEARTGRDYFLKTPYEGAFPAPTVNVWNDLVPVYDFPENVPWDASLSEEAAGRPIWSITGNQWGGFGFGMVDALTGVELRFMRPNQNHGTGGPNGAPSVSPSA